MANMEAHGIKPHTRDQWLALLSIDLRSLPTLTNGILMHKQMAQWQPIKIYAGLYQNSQKVKK